MSESKNINGPALDSDVTIDFGSRFAESDMFNKIFHEGMDLVEQTATYLDGDGRKESRKLARTDAMSYATESMRLTTRLMQLASWLLLQRAVRDGEMTADEAQKEKYRINLAEVGGEGGKAGDAALPEALMELIKRSFALYRRVIHLDDMLRTEDSEPERAVSNPVSDQMSRLRAAFGDDPGEVAKG